MQHTYQLEIIAQRAFTTYTPHSDSVTHTHILSLTRHTHTNYEL